MNNQQEATIKIDRIKNKTKLTRAEKEKYVKMLWFYRRHPELAARDILGVTLSPHQRIVLRSIWNNKQTYLVMSRGMSKTFLLALVAILYCLLYDSIKVLIASGQTFRQGQIVMEEAENILLGQNPSVKKTPFTRRVFGELERNKWRVLTRGHSDWSIKSPHTGSTIKTFPMNNIEAIRGYRAHVILLDERNAISDEMIQKAISPFANVKRNVLEEIDYSDSIENTFVHAGTIEYSWQGFARSIKSVIKRQRKGHSVVEFNYEDSYKYGINWEKIEEERDSDEYDKDTWASENKNQLREDADSYFGGKLVLQEASADWVGYEEKYVKNKENSKCLYFAGIDPARQQDSFAFTILKWNPNRNVLHPVYQYKWDKSEYHIVVGEIFKILQNYPVKRIAMDVGGGGYQVRDLLLKPANDSFDPIYDPSDEDGMMILGEKRYSSKNILRLLKPNAERNTQWNAAAKAMMQAGTFKFSDLLFVPRLIDKIEERVLKCMVECKKQFIMVKSRVTSNNSNLSFLVENGKKDLYSSVIYGISAFRSWQEEELKQSLIKEEELGIGSWV